MTNRSYSAFDYGPIALESNQRQCIDCEAYLSDYADPEIFIRNVHGQDAHYCEECSGDVIGPAVDRIFSIFELAPEYADEDRRPGADEMNVYAPHSWAAE